MRRTSAYAASAAADKVRDLLLKLFKSEELHFGEWLISTLPPQPKVTLDQITIEHIDAFNGPGITRERAYSQYSLLTTLLFKIPKKNQNGVMVPTNNPYHLDSSDARTIKNLINAARHRKGAPPIPLIIGGAVNVQGFVDYIEAEAAEPFALTDAEFGVLMTEVTGALKQSGKEQTRIALDFLTFGTPIATVGGVAKAFGDLWSKGEEAAVLAAEALKDPSRDLTITELNKCSPAYRILLVDGLKDLKQANPAYYCRFNQIIREAIKSGVNIEAKLQLTLGYLAICLRKEGYTVQAERILHNSNAKRFRNNVLPKNEPAETLGFMAGIRDNLVANFRTVLGRRLHPDVQAFVDVVPLDQGNITGLIHSIEAAPGANATEQQRRLTRRISKVLAAYEDYALAVELSDGVEPLGEFTRFIEEDVAFNSVTVHYNKLRSRTRPVAIEVLPGGEDKTFYPAPVI